jgi:hypothetical protein
VTVNAFTLYLIMSVDQLGERQGEWQVHSMEPHKKLTLTLYEHFLSVYFGSKRMTLLNQPFVFLFFINSTQTQEACLYPNKRTVGNRRSPHNQSGVNFPGQFQLKEGKEKSFCQQRVGVYRDFAGG